MANHNPLIPILDHAPATPPTNIPLEVQQKPYPLRAIEELPRKSPIPGLSAYVFKEVHMHKNKRMDRVLWFELQ